MYLTKYGKYKTKQTREEKLEKKRQAQKLRYQEIKNDPVKYAELKEKEKQKYQRKKKKGQSKSIIYIIKNYFLASCCIPHKTG